VHRAQWQNRGGFGRPPNPTLNVRAYRPDDAITGEAGARTVGQHPARIDDTLERDRLTRRRIVLVLTHWTHNSIYSTYTRDCMVHSSTN